MGTYYEDLGVGRDATDDQIRQAYRHQMRTFHPDLTATADDEVAALLNEAFRVLSDPDRRAAYDIAVAAAGSAVMPEPARYAPPSHLQGFDRGSWDIPDWPR